MKKLFHLLMAVQISAFAFASRDIVPSDAVLAAYYNQGEVCLCFFVPEELNCCSIVVTGSFNSWSSTIAECATVRSVTGYDGWYVSSFVPEAQPSEWGGIRAKPMMLDANGNFNWEYQVGAVTIIRGGVQVTAGGVSGEIDLYNYGTDAPNVFVVEAWKQNPCTAIYHNYTITVISDGCNNYAVPFIVGAITNWDFVQMTLDNSKTQANQAATYNYSFRAAEGLQYQIVSGLWDPIAGEMDPDAMPGWEDEAYMQKLVNGEWVRIPGDDGDNFLTNADANIVYDLRTDTLRWARCASDTIDPASDLHVEVGGLYYNLDATNHTAEVTSQVGGKPYWITEITTANIPSSVTYNNVTYNVTSIGEHAFHYCDYLTSVTIPNSVTSIGEEAFYRCIALTSITIPNSVTSIEEKAFWSCSGLTSITIPSSITSIANAAFRACSGLTSVTIPNSVTSIEESAFRECYNLISVTIPNSVTSMGESAFRDCFQLTSITVPSSVTSISAYAFSGCSHMTSVTIPNSITSIGERAFDGCRRLTSITCKAPNPPALGDNVFMSVDKSIPLYVPEGSVNAYQTADQWNEFTNIQGTNFDPEPSINYDHVLIGGLYYNLDAATQTAEVTSQNADYPYWTTSITTANIPSSVTYNNATYSVTSIEERAFRVCSALTSVTIPNSVTSIGMSAFAECRGLTSLTIGTGITRIEEATFEYCTSLTSVTIPNNVTNIGEEAFRDCYSLSSLTIGSGVTSIEQGAFRQCRALASITCNAVNPPTMGYNVFEDVNKSIPLYVPAASVNAYRTANEWRDFTNIQSLTPGPEPAANDYRVVYQISEGFPLGTEIVTLHLPVAPQIAGFTFLKWQVVAGDLENGIKIQAVYTATIENMPEVVINPANSAQKLIRNGRVYILTGDKTYTITGQEVR